MKTMLEGKPEEEIYKQYIFAISSYRDPLADPSATTRRFCLLSFFLRLFFSFTFSIRTMVN